MTPAEVVALLRSVGWLSDREIVASGVSVTDMSRSHSVYRVDVGAAPRWVLKTHRPPRGDFDGSFERELKAYELAEDVSDLKVLMPRFCGALGESVIAIEAIAGETAWGDGPGQPQAQVEVTSRLGQLHRATEGSIDTIQDAGFPWILRAMDFDSPEFVWSGAARAVLQRVAGNPRAVAELREARAQWNRTCLIHGDAKLDNVIIPRDRNKGVVLVDWELSGLGDPLWDLAALSLRDFYRAAAIPEREASFESAIGILETGLKAYSNGFWSVSELAKLVKYLAALVIQSTCTTFANDHSQNEELNVILGASTDLLVSSAEVAASLEARMAR